jgi:hypothetical protein
MSNINNNFVHEQVGYSTNLILIKQTNFEYVVLKNYTELHNHSTNNCIITFVVSPRPSPVVNHVLKRIVIMIYRLVSRVLISWRLMCC